MKRILVVGHSSGEERQRKLFETGDFKKVEVYIGVPEIWGKNRYLAKKYGNVQIIPLKTSNKNKITRYTLSGLEAEVGKIKPELIYYQAEPWSMIVSQSAKISKKYNIPLVVYSFENLKEVYQRRNRRYMWLNVPFEKYLLRNIKAVLAGNESAKNIIRKNGFRGPIKVLPISGIDTFRFKKFKKSTKKVYGLEKKKVVLFLGRIEREKGIYTILESMPLVCKEVSNALFLFVGSGAETNNLKQQIKNSGLSEHARFIENIDYSEVPVMMNAADVFVYPSQRAKYWAEQFGFSIPEALSCGLRVITTKSGAIPEFFGKYVHLIEPKNSEQLAEKILQVLNKKAKAEKYDKDYSNQKIAKINYEFLNKVAKKYGKE